MSDQAVKMPLSNRQRQSLRHIPDDWLYPVDLKNLFPRPAPIEVDLGCGKGRFLLAHAAAHPEINFLGIDRMLRRIRKIDNRGQRRGLENLRLMRIEGYYAVSYLLPPESISTYYIFFPDPWPKKRHHVNRLFNERFVEALHRTMVPGGITHIATDHLPYFEQICSIMRADARFEERPPYVPPPEERTDFELWYHDKKTIGRCAFARRKD